MKRLRLTSEDRSAAGGLPKRAGTTLTEVLMSVLLLGIGAVTIATLFPISILRTTQAVQKTNATVHRFNSEAMVDVHNLVNATDFPDPVSPAVTKGVIDPLGWHIMDAAAPTFRDEFGNDGSAVAGLLTRFNATTADLAAADLLCTSPDSFVEILTAPVESSTATDVTFAASVDLTAVAAGQKVILFARDGRHAQVRDIATVTGQTIDWVGDLPFTGVERARIQSPERLYTCLLTVRKLELADPTVDVVVFFRRGFGAEDERVYSWPGAETAFAQGVNEVQVDYSAAPTKPPLTVGSFVFDAENCRWYRISGVTDNAGAKTAVLKIDRPALEDSDSAILMRGIIDVFPIGAKTPQL